MKRVEQITIFIKEKEEKNIARNLIKEIQA